jgi:hypothetical protein
MRIREWDALKGDDLANVCPSGGYAEPDTQPPSKTNEYNDDLMTNELGLVSGRYTSLR